MLFSWELGELISEVSIWSLWPYGLCIHNSLGLEKLEKIKTDSGEIKIIDLREKNVLECICWFA